MAEYYIETSSTAPGSQVQTFTEYADESPEQVALRYAQERANFAKADASASVYVDRSINPAAMMWASPQDEIE